MTIQIQRQAADESGAGPATRSGPVLEIYAGRWAAYRKALILQRSDASARSEAPRQQRRNEMTPGG